MFSKEPLHCPAVLSSLPVVMLFLRLLMGGKYKTEAAT